MFTLVFCKQLSTTFLRLIALEHESQVGIGIKLEFESSSILNCYESENQGEVPEIPIVRDTSERDFENALRRLFTHEPQFTHRWAGQGSSNQYFQTGTYFTKWGEYPKRRISNFIDKMMKKQ